MSRHGEPVKYWGWLCHVTKRFPSDKIASFKLYLHLSILLENSDLSFHNFPLPSLLCLNTRLPFVSLQDSYALCRVFKKNGICSEIEEQGQCTSTSLSIMESSPQGVINEYETMSPDVPIASSSCVEEEDKDDSWMQFITDEPWCSSNNAMVGGEEISHSTFTD